MKPQILKKIQALVGKENVSQQMEDRICHSYDATKQSFLPEAVVKPITKEEISGILELANQESIPVYPYGAASGRSGGALPVKGGLVFDFIRMNRILEVNRENMMALVEPGVVITDLQKEVEKQGLFYPPDPASADFATIGGSVAECAGGLRCIKYGVTRDYVLALEVVLPTGKIIHTGRATLKSVTGYDLTRLMVGSEGTLGIFTRITLKLIPLPIHVATLGAFFKDIKEAYHLFNNILLSGILPRALEFMDQHSIRAVAQQQKSDVPAEAEVFVLIEIDGASAGGVKEEAVQVHRQLLQAQPLKLIKAEDENTRQELWDFRKAISSALFSVCARKVSEDICVARDKLLEMIRKIRQLEQEYHIPMAIFGHAGDGNLHVDLLIPDSLKDDEVKIEKAVKDILDETIKQGGTLSGEHGIGNVKADYLPLEIPRVELDLMKQIKHLVDPKGIMNPGKIFSL
ncbi:FAD-binding oxidoreductase [Planctomycetota bacterium]